jgi:hypothetical protein
LSNNLAPACPVSYGQMQTGRQWFADLVNSIPRAHDLNSAIRALNIINNVVTQITHGAPQVNNVYPSGNGGVTIVPGSNVSPYPASDWVEQGREYKMVRLENPDNPQQFIPLKVITLVTFVSEATGHQLIYEGPSV